MFECVRRYNQDTIKIQLREKSVLVLGRRREILRKKAKKKKGQSYSHEYASCPTQLSFGLFLKPLPAQLCGEEVLNS